MTTIFFKIIVQFLLKWLAKIYLRRTKPYVIVVSGTTGRHWIKEGVREVLEEKNFPVRANKKNFNAEIGLPLSILGLSSGDGDFWGWLKVLLQGFRTVSQRSTVKSRKYLVLEMAIDRPDDMDYLLSVVKPQTAILTTITMIYQENFENLDEIASEYRKLVGTLPWDGFLILNFDDERIKNLAKFFEGKKISYGFSDAADFQARHVRKIPLGQEFHLHIANPKANRLIQFNRFGNHHVYAALIKEIIKENFKMPQQDFFSSL
jgi:UDP-N-acetylmuramoyl-tripeptide--D-alanyl-D-alanine ligase